VIEPEPLGTGGAIRLALTACRTDHAFVFNGDTYLELDAAAVNVIWQTRQNPIVVARAVEETMSYGRLLVEGDRVVAFTEKGVAGPGLINAGCYVFGTGDLASFPLHQPFSVERDFFQKVVSTRNVHVHATSGMFIDIGVPEDYLRANDLFAGSV
jgi:D-glycero-alpha-D-manno-heptose 1-phosphate guanylyltransferase